MPQKFLSLFVTFSLNCELNREHVIQQTFLRRIKNFVARKFKTFLFPFIVLTSYLFLRVYFDKIIKIFMSRQTFLRLFMAEGRLKEYRGILSWHVIRVNLYFKVLIRILKVKNKPLNAKLKFNSRAFKAS